ncbi:hypothetical protein GGI12_001501 [Dipsacomyces acuminosporus]|nr:hypothetical protein GGI12_001501 [Dipsacomyces acuminosporus]
MHRHVPSDGGSRPKDSTARVDKLRSQQQQQQQQDTDKGGLRPSSTPPETSTNIAIAGGGAAPISSGQKLTLPPVTAINSPLGMADMSLAWGSDSLRSGPLSPAMLGGPTMPITNGKGNKPATSKLGSTDPTLHTGLTPFLANEQNSANIASPGLQALLRAAVNGKDITTTPGGSLHIAPTPGPTNALKNANGDVVDGKKISPTINILNESSLGNQGSGRENSPSASVSVSTVLL